jgi:hypothetical protein
MIEMLRGFSSVANDHFAVCKKILQFLHWIHEGFPYLIYLTSYQFPCSRKISVLIKVGLIIATWNYEQVYSKEEKGDYNDD